MGGLKTRYGMEPCDPPREHPDLPWTPPRGFLSDDDPFPPLPGPALPWPPRGLTPGPLPYRPRPGAGLHPERSPRESQPEETQHPEPPPLDSFFSLVSNEWGGKTDLIRDFYKTLKDEKFLIKNWLIQVKYSTFSFPIFPFTSFHSKGEGWGSETTLLISSKNT